MQNITDSLWHGVQVGIDKIFSPTPRSAVKRYSVAIGILVLWAAVKVLVVDGLDIVATTHLVTLVVIFSALYGGFWPGIMVTVLGGVLNDIFFMSPRFSLLSPETQFTTFSFFITGFAISIIIEALRQAQMQKSEFMGFAAHEIKNPLATILGYADLIKKKSIERRDKQFFEFGTKISQQVKKSTTIINDLLDVTRIEVGKLGFATEKFNLYDLIAEIVELQNSIHKSHKITLSGKSKKMVLGDRQRIGQVVVNLITNAIKYSPNSDKIAIRITNSSDWVTVQIQDHGLGIEPKYVAKIFDPFFRIKKVEKHKIPGSGLGLYFSNEVVRHHKGKLWVKSRLGHGSAFFMTLPAVK